MSGGDWELEERLSQRDKSPEEKRLGLLVVYRGVFLLRFHLAS